MRTTNTPPMEGKNGDIKILHGVAERGGGQVLFVEALGRAWRSGSVSSLRFYWAVHHGWPLVVRHLCCRRAQFRGGRRVHPRYRRQLPGAGRRWTDHPGSLLLGRQEGHRTTL